MVGLGGCQGTSIIGIPFMYMQLFPTDGSSSWTAERGNRVRLFVLSVHVEVLLLVLLFGVGLCICM